MKRYYLAVAAALALPASTFAQGAKPCEELKLEIAKKLEAKQVKSYSLEIVPKEQEAHGKVVGTCEGGAKKIVYDKTPTASKNPAPAANKP
jgi:Protein of unknown function (DUF1161)